MKYIVSVLAGALLSSSAWAQHEIDLQKASNPPLNYLNLGNAGPVGNEIRVNNIYMEIGGKPVLPVMGEFHYVRTDHRYWRDTLLKMKASGVDMVAT